MEKNEAPSTEFDQDYNKQEDTSTLSVWENVKEAHHFYIAVFLTFFCLTLVYPVLMFRIDLTGYVPLRYKYIYLNFVYTIGELVGKVIHMFYKIRRKGSLNWGVLSRLLSALGIFLVSQASGLCGISVSSFLMKTMACLFQGLSIGYVFNMVLDIGQLHFQNRPYDALKFGQIVQYCIQVGNLLGSLMSSLF